MKVYNIYGRRRISLEEQTKPDNYPAIEENDILAGDIVQWRETYEVTRVDMILNGSGRVPLFDLKSHEDGQYFLVKRPDPEADRKQAVLDSLLVAYQWTNDKLRHIQFEAELDAQGYKVVKK